MSRYASAVVRALPFPRDLAAAAALRDMRALLTGRPPSGISAQQARLRHDAEPGRELLGRGRPHEAMRAAEALLALTPSSEPALRLALDAQMAAGQWGAALGSARRLRDLDASPRLEALERDLAGRMLTGETDWVPSLPVLEPCGDPNGCTLVLQTQEAGEETAAWTALAATAARDAGLRPLVAVGRVGDAPRKDPSPWPEDQPHVVVDLGGGYPDDAPADRRLTDLAWACARTAQRVRPSRILVAVAEPPGPLAVGIAVSVATGLPLWAVTRSGGSQAVWPGTTRRLLDRVARVVELPTGRENTLTELLGSPAAGS